MHMYKTYLIISLHARGTKMSYFPISRYSTLDGQTRPSSIRNLLHLHLQNCCRQDVF